MAEPSYIGGCQCGAVRYEAQGVARNLCLCHCESCRRSAGAPVVAWATFERDHFRVTHGSLSEYRSSAPVRRGFCARCGSSLTFRNDSRPQEIDVTLATLDEPARLSPVMHVWADEHLPWVSLEDGRPRHGGGG
jgi:hypothetical protein